MKNIADIDKNLKVETTLKETDIKFYNVKDYPERLFGLLFDEQFRRIPEDLAKATNNGVYNLHTNTSGGRFRFVTDSPYVAISTKMPNITRFPHMPPTGTTGFDLYVGDVFRGMFKPAVNIESGYDSIVYLKESGKKEITINFPLYNNVTDVFVGVKEGSVFDEACGYKSDKRVIYYGSSITQGGCVSRPGNSYPAIVSRMLDRDFVNLGFSGSARGELCMAEYIAKQEHSVFVLDYDHNAPTLEHLEETHEVFFKEYRKVQKDTPVVMISAPDIRFDKEVWQKRREVIKRTYENAVAAGDKNVYFIDGETLWDGFAWDSCTMDCVHPNDLGHMRMAQVIAPVIKNI